MIYEGKGFYFRMGDKVKIIDASFFGVSKHIGKTAVVRAVCFDGMLKLESSGANIGTYHHSSLKLIEGAPVKFKSGDKVKVIGPTFQGNANFLGLDGVIMNVNVYGDYRIKFADDTSLSFPPSSLKLIENNTEKAHRELNKTIIKIDKEMIKHLKKSKKAHDLINQTSKNIKQTDTVNSPSHYNQTNIEAIDIIEDVTAGYQSNVKYHIGNAIKYLIRAPFKNNTVEDLKKAVWYINRAVGKLEGEQNKH